MSEELLSIVVPVYNVREYLDECVTSILDQAYRNIEVILSLDCPTDGSDEICEKYARLDKRVKLIVSEKNCGTVHAWKSGVKAASGEYLGFVDADDYIDADMYQRLMECKGDFDLVISRWKREENGHMREAYDILEPGPYTTTEDMAFLLEHIIDISVPGGGEHIKSGIAPFVWNKLYKTDIARAAFQNIGENIAVTGDQAFVCCCILQCRSVLISDICGYHYRIRSGSNCHFSNINKSTADARDLYNTLEPVFMAHPRKDVLMPQLQKKVARILARAPSKMGFCKEAQNHTYVFPFFNLLNGKHIALYGAGEFGQVYWRQIHRHGMCEVDMWVDKKWEYFRREGHDVSPVETLLNETYEYVVIAVDQHDAATEIRRDLISMGVAEDKILWKVPVELS